MKRGARTISFRRSACGRRVLARWSCERRGGEIMSGRRRLVVIESERAERPAGGAHDATARQRRARAEGARRVRQSKATHLDWLRAGRVGRQDEIVAAEGPWTVMLLSSPPPRRAPHRGRNPHAPVMAASNAAAPAAARCTLLHGGYLRAERGVDGLFGACTMNGMDGCERIGAHARRRVSRTHEERRRGAMRACAKGDGRMLKQEPA